MINKCKCVQMCVEQVVSAKNGNSKKENESKMWMD